ncbi:4Fe-4S dicluster domain-containing protein [Sulfolobus sp. E5-1-F]|uniref:ferredoxin family protein n=1 Tax=Saccharolobus sp. E5-1-F TaxID=2663019 RepID=UPI0012978ED2|nr:ferredoxin family protein [Sulfolobus sp. E5-1-F]QGA53110.1 4Fe-4S dicluster domain-containing protein [Sulfolobus sp. E5-1-F]
MRVEEKLYTLRYKKDEQPHLAIIDPNKCLKCEEVNGVPQPCISVCPANVYSWINQRIVISYENCVECGACRIACPYSNISWKYPRYGLGIALRYG